MWRFFMGITLFILLISACRPNTIEKEVNEQSDKKSIIDVVSKHGHIQNLDALNSFVENVTNQNKTEINYVRYGIEGQRGVMTLTFNSENINVFHEVDGNFIEEYKCKNVIVKTNDEVKKYILIQCSGDFEGDFELLEVSTKQFN